MWYQITEGAETYWRLTTSSVTYSVYLDPNNGTIYRIELQHLHNGCDVIHVNSQGYQTPPDGSKPIKLPRDICNNLTTLPNPEPSNLEQVLHSIEDPKRR